MFQVTILKSFYALNPKPKREELQQIADNIGHPFKVIKVWFQNTRARDRKEKRKLARTAQALAPPPPPPPQQVRLKYARSKTYPENDRMFRIHITDCSGDDEPSPEDAEPPSPERGV